MTEQMKINGEKFELLITEEKIRQRVKDIASLINTDYAGRLPIFIGVLNGSFIFLADLIREVTMDCEIDFLKLSSYGDAKDSSGGVKILKELNCNIAGRDVIIVEDIVDSGLTVGCIKKLVEKENPRSVKYVALLLKKGLSGLDSHIDYIGFEIPPDFVVGYGLDYGQKVRNLRSIYRLSGEK